MFPVREYDIRDFSVSVVSTNDIMFMLSVIGFSSFPLEELMKIVPSSVEVPAIR